MFISPSTVIIMYLADFDVDMWKDYLCKSGLAAVILSAIGE